MKMVLLKYWDTVLCHACNTSFDLCFSLSRNMRSLQYLLPCFVYTKFTSCARRVSAGIIRFSYCDDFEYLRRDFIDFNYLTFGERRRILQTEKIRRCIVVGGFNDLGFRWFPNSNDWIGSERQIYYVITGPYEEIFVVIVKKCPILWSRLSELPIRDFYPGSWFLPLSNPGSRKQQTATKERGEKKFVLKPFFVGTNFTNCKLFYVMRKKKKFGPVFKELQTFLPKNLSLSSKKYGVGIRDPKKNLSRIRGQGSETHRIPDPDQQHCRLSPFYFFIFYVYGKY